MSAADFPSGPWTGYFTYAHVPGKWRTELNLGFQNGRMTGEGSDSVGPFVIAGAYDVSTMECHWTKTYVGAHDVFYIGFREGKEIWGTWQIGAAGKGGFQIWPLGTDGGCEAEEIAEEKIPAQQSTIASEPRNFCAWVWAFASGSRALHPSTHGMTTGNSGQM